MAQEPTLLFWMQMTGGARQAERTAETSSEETGYVLCSTGRELMNADGSSTGRTTSCKREDHLQRTSET